MCIRSSNQGQPEFFRDIHRAFHAQALDIQSIVLDLDKKIVLEVLGKPTGQLAGLGHLFLQDQFAELAGGAS